MPDTQAQQLVGTAYTPLIGIKGRNGYDDPFMLPNDQVAEAINVDWYGSSLARRRPGSEAIGITGGTAFDANGLVHLGRYVPSGGESAAQMFGADWAGLVKRLAGGVNWANVTLADAMTAAGAAKTEMNSVTFNNKQFFAYDTAVNRLHVYDGTSIRRVGIGVAGSVTVADTGAGAYAATIRYYRIRFGNGTQNLLGELGPVVAFTPSGAGTAARVTRPAAPGDSEDYWEVFVSSDGGEYFHANTIILATTFWDDTFAPTAWGIAGGDTAPDDGTYLPPPSAKYIVADDARLVMAGIYETTGGEVTPVSTRIWWTPAKGTDVGDDERISITDTIENFDDIDEPVTGLSKPINGAFFAFSYSSQYKFVATGDVLSPYQRFRVTGGQGCISHKAIIIAADETGYPATYWLSSRGPERSASSGNQFCGADIQDIWDLVNLDSAIAPHGVYHERIHQIWWYVAVNGQTVPNLKLVFDTWLGKVTEISSLQAVRYGWSQHTGDSCNAYCSVMFANDIGATMGRRLVPYVGPAPVVGVKILRCDVAAKIDDGGLGYAASITSKPLAPWGLGRLGELLQEPILVAKVGTGQTIVLTIARNEGTESIQTTCLLNAISDGATETRVFAQFDGARFADASSVRFTLTETVPVVNWSLDALIAPMTGMGDR